MTFTVQKAVDLDSITCPECRGVWAIDRAYQEEAQRLGNFKLCWTCPYCKTERGYGKGESDKVRAELAEAQRRLTATSCNLASERTQRERVERELKRHQKRTKNGVCPCCQRSFVNLKRHIKTKHPQFSI